MVLAGERYKRTTANIGPCYGQLSKPDLLSQAVRVFVALCPLSYVLRYPGCITPLPLPSPPHPPPPPNHHHHSILWLTLVCFVTRLNYVVLRINGHISGRVCGYLSLMKTFLLNTERNLRRWLGPAHLLTQPGPKDNGESEVFQPGSPGGYSLSYPRLRWPHCLWLL